ncbi:CBS domain-containing protein [Candidatus Uabimicrobium amorphum]|uniref:CBS domain-containing protein n=1 Tax=Uabimicrobium amorphum TaxID=2596890 RepID=A0A5S9IM37_UABAM|nr:CBS domain-containing protein [Candidatus Uabimicrobium amorphum]BBM84408.1 CBS domain-containing protein [Candidatus Uabimicrobium amorphum]
MEIKTIDDLKNLTAKDIMTDSIICINHSASFEQLMHVFSEHKIGGVVVVDDNDEIKGVVSIYDLIESQDEEDKSFYRGNIETPMSEKIKAKIDIEDRTLIEKIMTPIVIHASEDTAIPELARMMVNAKIHRVIVAKKGQYVGVVTTMDIVRALSNL